jgi:hypothetical protein
MRHESRKVGWRRLAAAGALCAMLAPTARAGGDADPAGVDLLARCHQLEEESGAARERDHGYCLGYLVGYVSGFAARDAAGTAGRFCPPVNARIADFASAINEWLVHNPDALETLGAVVALRAFQWKFPCEPRSTEPPDQ